jgi:hypothetical protein
MEQVRERRMPWNKGKFTGSKPPLRLKHVWSIRSKLQVEGRKRDLAMFNLAIDSKGRRRAVPPDESARRRWTSVRRLTPAASRPRFPRRAR